MSNHNYPRRLLDDAIDRAVQELVHAEPRPGFRRRVLERLNAPPRRMSLFPRLLVPAGAVAAVVMLAILVLKPAPQRTSLTPPVSVTQAPAPSAPVVSTAPPPQVRPPGAAPMIVHRRGPVTYTFGSPTDRVSATNLTDPVAAVSIEPSDEAAAPHRDVISRIVPIAIPSITIRPIEVKEIK